MKEKINQPKKNRSFKKYLLWITGGLFTVMVITGIILYYNFNRILSDALMKSFNSSIASDVYELKFKNLNVNLLKGNIKVRNVELNPREKHLKEYPYINSSVRLTTKKLLLTNVEIATLFKLNILKLERIEIDKPEVDLIIADVVPVFIPFKDSTAVQLTDKQESKRSLESFFLKEFKLINGSFHVANSAKHRDLSVKKVNITLSDLMMDQHPGKDLISYSHIGLNIGEITGSLQKDKIKFISLKDYKLTVDSLEIQKTHDTLIYHFADYGLGLNDLNLQTEDSIFHMTMQSFQLSYNDKSINLKNLAFKPNISNEQMQKRFKFQNTQFAGSVGSLNVSGINFDSLLYGKKLFIDEISIDSVSASIYKDKTKPIDANKFPEYLGQSVKAISLPLLIKKVTATNVNILNDERKPDSTYAKVNINRGTAEAKNISNINTGGFLSVKANAYLENKARFYLNLDFSYLQPQFNFEGRFNRFNLTDLNKVIESYAPAKIKKGIIDEITFSGIAKKTDSNGTMKFLYHDLELEVELLDQAHWKNSLLSFAANNVIASSNPVSESLPPKEVRFQAERDMNKAFINLILKSVLAGLKETIFMSNENKKLYREEKKRIRKENKE
ncbi:MAG: hypothetical protein EP310_04300 [Bacteroidetes bacterium]|nr:MAG: hypothetical protein EP310_04300 [Bacteroidota bacterium]